MVAGGGLKGFTASSKNRPRRHQPRHISRAREPGGQKALAGPGTKGEENGRRGSHQAKAIKPEQVIPMEEGDFKEF